MKIESVKRIVPKTVITTTTIDEEIDIFVTSDKKEFGKREDAITHENILTAKHRTEELKNKLKIKQCDEFVLCYVESMEDAVEYFNESYCHPIKIDYPLNQWFTVEFYDGGDYKSDYSFYPFSDFKKEYEDMIEHMEGK